MRGWIFARQTVRLQSRCGRAAVAATPCTRPPVTRSNRSGSVRSFLREIDGHAFSTFDFGKSSILANRGGLGDDPRAEFSSDESSSFFFYLFFFYLSSASVFWIILRWLIFIFEREFFFQFLKYLVETNIKREREFLNGMKNSFLFFLFSSSSSSSFVYSSYYSQFYTCIMWWLFKLLEWKYFETILIPSPLSYFSRL